jgi:alpha-tubulin suppressor-like RCC1 family protein
MRVRVRHQCGSQRECKRRGGRGGQGGGRARRVIVPAVSLCVLLTTVGGGSLAAGVSAAPGVVGWGDNYRDDLGVGYGTTGGGEFSPVSTLGGLSGVTAVAAGGPSSYALLTGGALRAWGGDDKHQLGGGGESRENRPTPIVVMERTAEGVTRELTGVVQVAAAYGAGTHVIALVNNAEHEKEVFTWGASELGERGNGESGFSSEGTAKVPRNVAIGIGLRHVIQIAAGAASDFALVEESGKRVLWGWGDAEGGKLGTGAPAEKTCVWEEPRHPRPCNVVPTKVDLPAGVTVKSIGAGRTAAYAVLTNGRVLAWGKNDAAQLGNGTTTATNVPGYVCAIGTKEGCTSLLEGIQEVSGGDSSAIALTEGGEVVGWGSNGNGQLGGTTEQECGKKFPSCQLTPKRVLGLSGVSKISEGAAFSLALVGGTIYSFGDNQNGQLGDGTEEGPETCGATACDRTPTPITGLPPVAGMAGAGGPYKEEHSVAFLASGQGPASKLTLTPGSKTLTLHWTFSASEFRVNYRKAVVGGVEKGKEKFSKAVKAECTSKPCAFTVEGLAAEPYELKLQSYHVVKGKEKAETARLIVGIPNP